MPSFDTVLEAEIVKVKNAVENTAKEIVTRFDFKGTSASIELKDKDITLIGDSDFQIDQINDILRNKLTKAAVDVRFLDLGKIEKIGGDKVNKSIKCVMALKPSWRKKFSKPSRPAKSRCRPPFKMERCALPVPSATICKPPWRCCARMSPTCRWNSITSGTEALPRSLGKK